MVGQILHLALKHLSERKLFLKTHHGYAILKLWDHTEVSLFRQAKYDIEAPLLAYRNIADPFKIWSWTICPTNLQGQGKQPFSLHSTLNAQF